MLQGQWAGLQAAPPAITNWDTGRVICLFIQCVKLLYGTGCPIDLMKFVGAKSVQIPEGKVVIG